MKRSRYAFAFLLLVVFLFKIPVVDTPYFWDAHFFTSAAELVLNRNFIPDYGGPAIDGKKPGLDSGHFPLFFELVALGLWIGKGSVIAPHIIILIFSFIGVFYTYLLGAHLYSRKIGMYSAILLFFTPLYFAQSGLLNLDLLLAALAVPTIYYAIKRNILGYSIAGGMLALAKEPAILVLLPILFYIYIRDKSLKSTSLYSLPVIIFFSWLIFHWMVGGFLFYEHHFDLWYKSLFKLPIRFRQVFLDSYRWILTGFILASFLHPRIKTDRKRLPMSICIGASVSLLVFQIDRLIIFLPNVIELGLDQGLLAVKASYFKAYSLFFGFIAFFFHYFKGGMSMSNLKRLELLPMALIVLVFILFFSYVLYAPRYLLPVYPFIFIISISSMRKVLKRLHLVRLEIAVVALIIILFATQWNGTRTNERPYFLEDNLEYLDVIETHQKMDSFIEENYPDAVVLTVYPMVVELRLPLQGYVKSTHKVIDLNKYDIRDSYRLKKDNYRHWDWYYYDCYLDKTCYDKVWYRPIAAGRDVRDYDRLYKEKLTREDFDLYYFSPQSNYYGTPELFMKVVDDFDLKLIKRYEKNGKVAELYG